MHLSFIEAHGELAFGKVEAHALVVLVTLLLFAELVNLSLKVFDFVLKGFLRLSFSFDDCLLAV